MLDLSDFIDVVSKLPSMGGHKVIVREMQVCFLENQASELSHNFLILYKKNKIDCVEKKNLPEW